MTEKNEFSSMIEAAGLTDRQEYGLACLISGTVSKGDVPCDEESVIFPTKVLPEILGESCRGYGAVWTGMDKRFDAAEIYSIWYDKHPKLGNAFFLNKELFTQAVEWASKHTKTEK